MPLWRPDPTFYPSPRLAMEAPAEKLAYVAMLNAGNGNKPDALGVVDVDPSSSGYGRIVGQMDMPNAGDELHHFGWNACSACLCPYAPHPHVERRYLVVPGLRSSRIHIVDTKPDPRKPQIVKVIEPESSRARPAIRGRTRSIAGRTAFTSARSARRTAMVRAASSCSTTRASTCSGVGDRSRPARPRLRFLVAPRLRHADHQRMGNAEHGRERARAGDSCWRANTATNCTSGICAAPPHSGTRSRRRTSDGAGAAPCARSDARLRFRRRGRFAEGSFGVDLDVASRRTASGRFRKSSRFPRSRPIRRRCRRC